MKYRMKRHAVVQPLDQSYKIIPLTKGQNALVDAEDFERLSAFNWSAHWNPHTKSYYAMSARKCKSIYMHREILGCNARENGDHFSHDTLDNRKQNLRKCNDQQNNFNHRKRKDNTSGFKGVHLRDGKWRSRIFVNGQWRCLGYFHSKEAAAHAYNEAALRMHGEFAHLNAL
jgi:hypothetical protein